MTLKIDIQAFLETGLLKHISLSHWLILFFAPSYWKSKISTQKEILEYMNFHVIETSVLKLGNKSEAFLISPENKAFKGQF